MKAVLLSVQPEWCEKILSGEKTVEVRRTCPVHGTPFKVYIYCTLAASKAFVSDDRNWDVSAGSSRWPDKRGRVIGEFICKKMTGLTHVGETGSWEPAHLYVMAPGSYYKPADELLEAACMSKETAEKYLKGRDGYGWHISDLRRLRGSDCDVCSGRLCGGQHEHCRELPRTRPYLRGGRLCGRKPGW